MKGEQQRTWSLSPLGAMRDHFKRACELLWSCSSWKLSVNQKSILIKCCLKSSDWQLILVFFIILKMCSMCLHDYPKKKKGKNIILKYLSSPTCKSKLKVVIKSASISLSLNKQFKPGWSRIALSLSFHCINHTVLQPFSIQSQVRK